MIKRIAIILITTLTLTANVSAGSDGDLLLKKNEPSNVKDCFEGINRATFKFNQALDGVIFKPVASVYKKLPSPLKNGVSNSLENLSNLVTIPNNLLQGNFTEAGINSGRLLMFDKSKNLSSKPEILYKLAKLNFDEENFELAREQFKEINKLFPLSNEAIQSEIMIAFIYYIQMDYENAILNYKRISNKYPSHKDLDYVYYMIAMCNYEQIQNEALDGYYNDLALNAFDQVIKRFPDSNYSKDSRQKMILVKSNIAAKHMDIGRFYLNNKKYIAALNRFKIVVEKFSITKFTPEALHRMVEAYYEMGMYEESYNTASLLGYNYPESKWYQYNYNLVKQIEDEETILKKIRNFFDG